MADTTSPPTESHVDKNTTHHVNDVNFQEKTSTDTESLASVSDEPVCQTVLSYEDGRLTNSDDFQEVHG